MYEYLVAHSVRQHPELEKLQQVWDGRPCLLCIAFPGFIIASPTSLRWRIRRGRQHRMLCRICLPQRGCADLAMPRCCTGVTAAPARRHGVATRLDSHPADARQTGRGQQHPGNRRLHRSGCMYAHKQALAAHVSTAGFQGRSGRVWRRNCAFARHLMSAIPVAPRVHCTGHGAGAAGGRQAHRLRRLHRLHLNWWALQHGSCKPSTVCTGRPRFTTPR